MADYLTTDTELTSIADEIRSKSGVSEELTYPSEFITAIESIPSAVVISDSQDSSGGIIRTMTPTDVFEAKTSSDLVHQQNIITAPAGYYAENATIDVGNANVTVSATKGTVQSNAIAITPSGLVLSGGWIGPQSIEGDSVVVSASELVSGTLSITENGTKDVKNYASVNVNVSGGGGSGGNVATGTFKASSATFTGTLVVTITTTSTSYPKAIFIYPSGGLPYNSTFTSLLHGGAIGIYAMIKGYQSTTPTYTTSGTANYGNVLALYKSSASSATTYASTFGNNLNIYSSGTPSSTQTNCVKVNGNKSLRVHINKSSTGFDPTITYAYYVVY